MAYNPRYQVDFRSRHGTPNRVTILERDFSGTLEQLSWGGNAPFRVEYDRQGLKGTVAPSTATLTIHTEDNFKFREFFVADDKQFIMKHEVDEGSGYVENWIGHVVPDEHFERYVPKPYRTEIKAIDGIGMLEGETLVDYSGRKTVAFVLHALFNKIDDIYDGNYYANFDSHEGSMDTGVTPLTQVYVDRRNYTKKTPNQPDADDMDCLEILKAICETFQLHVFRDRFDGASHFMVAGNFERRPDSQTWTKITNGEVLVAPVTNTFRRTVESDVSDNDKIVPILHDHDLMIDKAYKESVIDYQAMHIFDENRIPNGNWRDVVSFGVISDWQNSGITVSKNKAKLHGTRKDSEWGDGMIISGGGFTDYIEMTNPIAVTAGVNYEFAGSFRYAMPSPDFDHLTPTELLVIAASNSTESIRLPRLKIDLRLEGDSGTDYWLQWLPRGHAGRTDPEVAYYWQTSKESLYWRQKGDSTKEFTVELPTLPESGNLFVRIYGREDWKATIDTQHNKFTDTGKTDLTILPISFHAKGVDLEQKIIKQSSDISYTTEPLESEVIHIDGTGTPAATTGALTDGNGNALTDGWKFDAADSALSVIQHKNRLLLNTFRKPLRTWSGTLWSADNISYKNNIILTEEGVNRVHLPVKMEIDYRNSQVHMGALVELLGYDVDLIISTNWNDERTGQGWFPKTGEGSGDTGGMDWIGDQIPDDDDMPPFSTAGISSEWQRNQKEVNDGIQDVSGQGSYDDNKGTHFLTGGAEITLPQIDADTNLEGDIQEFFVPPDEPDGKLLPFSGEKIDGSDYFIVPAGRWIKLIAHSNEWHTFRSSDTPQGETGDYLRKEPDAWKAQRNEFVNRELLDFILETLNDGDEIIDGQALRSFYEILEIDWVPGEYAVAEKVQPSDTVEVSADYTVERGVGFVLVDTSSGSDITITLPDAENNNREVTVKKKEESSTVTVDAESGTIDGAETDSLTGKNQAAMYKRNRLGNWFKIAELP